MTIDSLIRFITYNKNWRELLSNSPYNLKIKEHPSKPGRFLLSYNMIESDFSLDIVQVSRGIVIEVDEVGILDKSKDYTKDPVETQNRVKIIVRAFDKFFNYGEGHAAQIDWSGPVYAREKLDGSIIKYRNLSTFSSISSSHDEIWMTNNSFTANIDLPGDLLDEADTFQDLINMALEGHNILNLKLAGEKYTLIFELTSSYNRVVVKYDGPPKLWLLGARDMDTQKEISPELIKETYKLDFDTPKTYELTNNSIEEALKIVNEMDSNHEGLVICDKYFNRIKIKSEQYLSIHRMKDVNGQLSFPHLLKCIQAGTVDDILSIFPEKTYEINQVINMYKKVAGDLDSVNKEAQLTILGKEEIWGEDPVAQKKGYALKVKDSLYSRIYFEIWKNPKDYENIKNNYLNNLEYDKLVNLQ